MRILGNILWFLIAGLWFFLGFVIAGVLNCVTIIGIPFGLQAFKLAGYVVWPFGRVVIYRSNRDTALGFVGNVIWLILGGIGLALGWVIAGVIFCITIIGIPFGIVAFRMAGLALVPFGKVVVPHDQVPPGADVYLGKVSPLG